jgi:predicted nucleic-acid-binding protein
LRMRWCVKARGIDANVILRVLLGDQPQQSPRCRGLLERVEAGEEQVYLPEVVLSDVVWTLRSFYKVLPGRIAEVVMPIIGLEGVVMKRKSLMKEVLLAYGRANADFSDVLMAVEILSEGVSELYSYDRDFDRMSDIIRVEP